MGTRSILDGLGLAVAGQRAESGRITREYLGTLGIAGGPSTVIGTELRTAPRFAAFANGVGSMPTITTNAARGRKRPGVRAADSSNRAGVARGAGAGRAGAARRQCWPTGPSGSKSSARSPRRSTLAITRTDFTRPGLRRLRCGGRRRPNSRARRGATARALSIAASQSAGLRENFGTMTKPFHAGRAAESGVVAAELAALGLDRGRRTSWRRTAGSSMPRVVVTTPPPSRASSGSRGPLTTPGSRSSRTLGLAHPPGHGVMLDLIRSARHSARAGEAGAVGTNQNMPNALIHHRPRTELQAKFSMEFCMAILLLERRAGLARVHRRGGEPRRTCRR